jgi:hypothetical protein
MGGEPRLRVEPGGLVAVAGMIAIGATWPFATGLVKVSNPPIPAVPTVAVEGRFGIMTARALLLGAVSHPNIPGAHPQHPSERLPWIGPVPHQRP